MSPDLALPSVRVADAVLSIDRRLYRRYAIALDVRYKLLCRGRVLREGVGKTCDLSTGGLFFRADHALSNALDVELSMDWPFQLNGVCPLQLRIIGKVLRTSSNGSAVRITHHEFRTRGMRPPATV